MLSIIIVHYKTFELTRNCIESIFKNTLDVSFEVILVDNYSNDGSLEKLFQLFPNIKYIHNSDNYGFSRANNIGISNSLGDYILLLNSDTLIIDDTISYCYNYLKINSNSIVSCKLIYPNNDIQFQCSRFPSILLNLIELFRIHKLWSKEKAGKVLLSSYFNHDEFCEPDWVWGTFFMFKKSSLESLKNKKLDERYFMYGEDIQWCYDFKKNGFDIKYLNKASVIHFVGKSSENDYIKFRYIVKNELDFVKRNKGYFYLFFYRLIKIILLITNVNRKNITLIKLYLKC